MMVSMTRDLLAIETVSHDPAVLAAGRITKSASDHVSVRVVKQIVRVHHLNFSGLIGQNKLSKVFFQTTVMMDQWPKVVNSSIANGCQILRFMVPPFETCPGS